MQFDSICKKFQSRIPVPEGRYDSYAVLVPLVYVDNEAHLLFEVRSEKLNTQPGEICFPGGRIEENESPMESAIRETCEELNIEDSNIKVLGPTDYVVTPFNLILYPFIGVINNVHVENINYNSDEVGSIFTVPLSFFMDNDPETHYVKNKLEVSSKFPFHKIQNGKIYNFRTGKYPIYFYEYKDYVIWGMTARIINNLINVLKMGD